MSDTVSHIVSVHKGLSLSFYTSTITYDPANPAKDHNKAVTINGDRTVSLTATGGRVDGGIISVEPADSMGVKVGVMVSGPVVFQNPSGQAALTAFGLGVIGGATAGSVANGAATDRGKLTSVEDGKTIVIL